MINKIELEYLKKTKRFSGMPLDQIESELMDLIINQKGHKIMKKQITKLEKDLKKSEEKIEKSKEESKRKDKEIFNLKNKVTFEKPIKEKQTNGSRTANVHQLKRILCLLEEEKEPMVKSKIFRACGMVTKQGDSALNFLVNNGLVKSNRDVYFK